MAELKESVAVGAMHTGLVSREEDRSVRWAAASLTLGLTLF